MDDWRSAPLRPELTATLVFLEKLTLRPDELTPADADEVRGAGVSDQALRDAATICSLFSMIVRLADSFGWDVPSGSRCWERAPLMLEGGYDLGAVASRARFWTSTARRPGGGLRRKGRPRPAGFGSRGLPIPQLQRPPPPAADPAAFRLRLYHR